MSVAIHMLRDGVLYKDTLASHSQHKGAMSFCQAVW